MEDILMCDEESVERRCHNCGEKYFGPLGHKECKQKSVEETEKQEEKPRPKNKGVGSDGIFFE